jgi:DNA modification methylase
MPALSPESVRLIVTSPPYPGQRANTMSVSGWQAWMGTCLKEMARLLDPATGVLALNVMFPRYRGWFDDRLWLTVPPLLRGVGLFPIDVYIWVKPNPPPVGDLRKHDIPAWEPIFLYARSEAYADAFRQQRKPYDYKSTRKSLPGNRPRSAGVGNHYAGGHNQLHPDGARQTNVIIASSSGDQNRPRARGGSFPRAIPERFIRQHTEPGDVVLDPFAGSGTTCVVAANLGRRFIGIEMDPDEAAVARAWLDRAKAQL